LSANPLLYVLPFLSVYRRRVVFFRTYLTSNMGCRLRLICDGTRAETRFRLSAKRTSPFKSASASIQSTTGSRGLCISGSSAGYTMFRGSMKSTGYSLHSPVSPSLPLPCATVCHHISTGLRHSYVPATLRHHSPSGLSRQVTNIWRMYDALLLPSHQRHVTGKQNASL
jgi:hypothetical protein